jgi:predicted phosphohydrolase
MNVFRLHIRPNGEIADSAFSFAYCLEEQVLGVGWQTYSDSIALSWEEYLKEAIIHHDDGDLSRVRYLKRNVRKDDLIWTRSPTGI